MRGRGRDRLGGRRARGVRARLGRGRRLRSGDERPRPRRGRGRAARASHGRQLAAAAATSSSRRSASSSSSSTWTARQPPDFELNVNEGEERLDARARFWFVLDAALAQEHAVPLLHGRASSEFFEPVSAERTRDAMQASLDWIGRQPPENAFARAARGPRAALPRARRVDLEEGGAGMTGFLALEDGTVFRGESVGRRGVRVRRGGLHDRDDRLPGGRHRPELRGAARLLHRADGRQLRRRAGPLRVAAAARARGRDARGPRAGLDGLAARARPGRALRDRHALARRAPARRRARCARSRSPARPRSRRRSRRSRSSRAMAGRALATRRLDAGAVRLLATRARRGSRSSTTAASARSSTGSRGRARP